MIEINSMASKKIFTNKNFLNSLIFSGIIFANTINAHSRGAVTQENINIPKVISFRSASCGCCWVPWGLSLADFPLLHWLRGSL